jgi:hypothetical protein
MLKIELLSLPIIRLECKNSSNVGTQTVSAGIHWFSHKYCSQLGSLVRIINHPAQIINPKIKESIDKGASKGYWQD